MVFENSQTFNIESKKMVNTEQFESVCRFIVSADKPIKRIVGVSALPKILSDERVGDSISFSGVTNYQIVYITEENQPCSCLFSQEWQQNIAYVGQGEYFLNVSAQENIISDFSQVEIILSTLLNVELFSLISDQIKPIVNLNEDYVTSEKCYNYNKVVNTVKDHFTEVCEHEVIHKVSGVLFNNAQVNVLNVFAGIDSISVEGEALLNTSLLVDGKVVNTKKVIEFKQEFSALSVVPENLIDLNVYIDKSNVTASVSDIDEKTNLIYTIDFKVDAVIYDVQNINIIEDAFSIKKQIAACSECLLKTGYLGQENFTFSIDSSIEADRNLQEVLYLSGSQVNITGIKTDGEESTISGCIELNLTCLDENGEIFTTKGFLPFATNANNVVEANKIMSFVDLSNFRLIDKREIEVNLKVYVTVKNYKDEYVTFLSKIEENEDLVVLEEAINVYIVNENEKLFDVAKNLCVKPENIIMQNELNEDEIKEGTRLVVYSPLNMSF